MLMLMPVVVVFVLVDMFVHVIMFTARMRIRGLVVIAVDVSVFVSARIRMGGLVVIAVVILARIPVTYQRPKKGAQETFIARLVTRRVGE